jgi:hypothetical protein
VRVKHRGTCSERRDKSSADDGTLGDDGGGLRRVSRRDGCLSLAGETAVPRMTAMRSAAAVNRNTDTTIEYAMLVEKDDAVSDHCMAPVHR